MVTFDSALEGTAASTWASDPRLTDAPELDLTGIRHPVVVSAHSDEETLGAGGLIAECSARGTDVTVIVVTDGAASHPGSLSVARGELADLRSREVVAATATLAPTARVVQLAFADGETREQRAEIILALRAMLGADARSAKAKGHAHGANLGIRANTSLRAGRFRAIPEHEDNDPLDHKQASGARIVASDRCDVETAGRRLGRTNGGLAQFLHGAELKARAAEERPVA